MKKKLLSILLTLCMALSLLPVTALAEESGMPVESTQQEETLSETAPTEPEQTEQAPTQETQEPQQTDAPKAPAEAPAQEAQENPLPELTNDLIAPLALTYAAEIGGQQYETLAAALQNARSGDTVTLLANVSEELADPTLDNLTLDLGGFTLTMTNTQAVKLVDGKNLTIQNGSIVSKGITQGNVANFGIESNASITLYHVKVDSTASVLYPRGDAAHVTVRDSEIKCGVYAVGTNAGSADNYKVVIDLENSTFTSTYGYQDNDGDSCPVMINVPGTLNMDGCTVTGSRQGVLVRGGTANIRNSTIHLTGAYTSGADLYWESNWGAGDEVPMAGLVVGNRSDAYAYPATCTLENTDVSAANGYKTVYLYGMDDVANRKVTFFHDDISSLHAIQRAGKAIVANVQGSGADVYTTVADALAANETAIKLLHDLTENVTIPVDKTVTLDLNGHVLSGGTVAGKPALKNNGTVVIRDSGTRGQICREDHNVVGYYVIDNQGTMTIEGGKIYNNTGTAPQGSSLIRNGGVSAGTANKLTISGGEIRQDGFIAVKNDDYGTLAITGGAITATGSNQVSTISAVQNWAQANISGSAKITGAVWTSVWSKDLPGSKTTIDGVNVFVDGPIVVRREPGYDCGTVTPGLEIKNGHIGSTWSVENPAYVSVSGGIFTSDPGAYAAQGMVSTASGNAIYPYTVIAKTADMVPVKPVEGEPDVPAADELPNTIPQDQKAAVATTAASVTVPVDTAANAVIRGIDDTKAQSLKDQAVSSGLTVGADDTVTIYVRTVMSVSPTSYAPDDGTLVLDITPRYELVASTATSAQGIAENNSKVVQAATKLPVSGTVQVSLTLPGGYTNETGTGKVFVQHQKGGVTYVYDVIVAQTGGAYTATFTNPHGFSTFTLTKAAPQAKIGSTSYATLQDAVNAVANGQTITALANGSATVSGNMTFTVETGGNTVTLTAAGGYDLSQSASGNTIAYTVSTHHSGGGSTGGGGSSGGSSSSSTYAVTVDKSSGGTVDVSPKRASKGDTVTVTVKPNNGYELDELTVTDKDGDIVKVSGKNGKFTFTMPKSAVTVEASFQKVEEAKAVEALPFADVWPGDWCYDAVKYVYDKGLMAGTSATAFNPGGTTTRGMIVTILYRMEGQPSIAGESAAFADVAPGQYYTDAVAWASARGIVSGYTNGNFGPNDTITREQFAAILYRYAGSPAASGMVLSEFTDAGTISGYAADAMRWAVGSGLITGKGNQILDPKGGATRAQAAAILMRFCELDAQ